MSLVWRGPQVLASVMAATKSAIDETTAKAAEDAEGSHWWANRSGNLEASIINEPATRQGHKVSGKFGTHKVRGFYGLFHERKTPFLRPAADREFPELAGRIRRRVM